MATILLGVVIGKYSLADAVDVPCTGTPQANANALCAASSPPGTCRVEQNFSLADGCQLDFGPRDVVVAGDVMVKPLTAVKCRNGTCDGGRRDGLPCANASQCPRCGSGNCFGGIRDGEPCTSHTDCPCAPGVSCAAFCSLCGPPCPACCAASGNEICGGSVAIHAKSLTVACGGEIKAPDPDPQTVPADLDSSGGIIMITTDESLVVNGRVVATGRNEGGQITLLPGQDLIVHRQGMECAGEVEANGTKVGTEDEIDGAIGGTIVFGESEDDVFPRTANVSIENGGAIRAEGGSFGEGGSITGAACGQILIDAGSEISAEGGQGFRGPCERCAGDIELAAGILTVDGTLKGGADGCDCLSPLTEQGRSCSSHSVCDSSPGAGDGICGGVCLAPAGRQGDLCLVNRDCNPPGGGGGVCGGTCREPAATRGNLCATDSDCDMPAEAGNGACRRGAASELCLEVRSVSVTGTIDPPGDCVPNACSEGCTVDGVCVDETLPCCGNQRVDALEECDDGVNDPFGPCPECRLPICGDLIRNQPSEQCDTDDLDSQTCVSRGFEGGTLGCTASCTFNTFNCFRCGNGQREGPEQCDSTDVGGLACQDIGFSGGQLGCFPPTHPQRCRFDTSACSVCGNGEIEAGESCDGAALGGATCQSLGFPGGTLACAPSCRSFDTRNCFVCGNGRREGAEECDTPDLGGATCDAPGETGGEVSCTTDCRLDRSTCFFCGNGRVDPGEECDDGNAALGDGCRPDCRSECGNGTVERDEECDDGNRTAADGCSELCALEQPFGGGGVRQDCAVRWGVAGGEARRRQECRDGDPRCDHGSTAGECTFLVFYCFNVPEIGFGGPVTCAPRDIGQVALRESSVTGLRALSPTDVDAFLNAVSATLARGGASVSRSGAAVQASPAVTARRLCGAVTLHVPLRQAFGTTFSARRRLGTEATDSTGTLDRDAITLVCEP